MLAFAKLNITKHRTQFMWNETNSSHSIRCELREKLNSYVLNCYNEKTKFLSVD